MGFLNGLSFLLIYLAIKKIIGGELPTLIIFACLLFWQYWSTRIPLAETTRAYYQYWPIRILFPSILFFLIVTYHTCAPKFRMVLLPLIALNSTFAILWNLDSGIVVFGATIVALFFSSLDSLSVKETVKKNVVSSLWTLGSLVFIGTIFLLSVKIQSHRWPDFKRFIEFQNVFYVSGYYMLPMARIHFWNLVVLVYLIAFICCAYYLKKGGRSDLPVLAFLVVLGCGVFSYYQGRSYDLTLNAVMYPAIIIVGIFCNKLLLNIHHNKVRYPEGIILFLISFLFLIDGAGSMLYYTPPVHTFAANNAFHVNPQRQEEIQQSMNFIKSNVPARDTVLILAQDYESYYYAMGQYYNPVNLPGSTEIFFKSQLDTLLEFIKTTRYPIIYDANRPWVNSDTIIKTLAKYDCIEKELPNQGMVLLKPYRTISEAKLQAVGTPIDSDCRGDFIKYLAHPLPKSNRH